jgi:hypothetical protein
MTTWFSRAPETVTPRTPSIPASLGTAMSSSLRASVASSSEEVTDSATIGICPRSPPMMLGSTPWGRRLRTALTAASMSARTAPESAP